MKTGYTCSAGYNVVESATRGDKRLLVVIMGAPSTNVRNLKAVSLFERFFGSPGSDVGPVADLPASDIVAAPDLRTQICGPGRRNAIVEAEAEDASISLTPAAAAVVGKAAERADVLGTATASAVASAGPAALIHARDPVVPVRVFIGPRQRLDAGGGRCGGGRGGRRARTGRNALRTRHGATGRRGVARPRPQQSDRWTLP